MIAVMERRAYAEDGNLLGDDALRTEWFRTLFDHSDGAFLPPPRSLSRFFFY